MKTFKSKTIDGFAKAALLQKQELIKLKGKGCCDGGGQEPPDPPPNDPPKSAMATTKIVVLGS